MAEVEMLTLVEVEAAVLLSFGADIVERCGFAETKLADTKLKEAGVHDTDVVEVADTVEAVDINTTVVVLFVGTEGALVREQDGRATVS